MAISQYVKNGGTVSANTRMTVHKQLAGITSEEQDPFVPIPPPTAPPVEVPVKAPVEVPVEAELIPSREEEHNPHSIPQENFRDDSEEEYNPHSIPQGHFRDELFDCCNVGCCHPSSFIACCFPWSKFKFKCIIDYLMLHCQACCFFDTSFSTSH